MQITISFRNMEDELEQLNASSSCKTPPSESWFTQKDLSLPGNDGEIESYIQGAKALAAPLEAHQKIAEMLKEECAHLLRKSQTAMSKAEKPSS